MFQKFKYASQPNYFTNRARSLQLLIPYFKIKECQSVYISVKHWSYLTFGASTMVQISNNASQSSYPTKRWSYFTFGAITMFQKLKNASQSTYPTKHWSQFTFGDSTMFQKFKNFSQFTYLTRHWSTFGAIPIFLKLKNISQSIFPTKQQSEVTFRGRSISELGRSVKNYYVQASLRIRQSSEARQLLELVPCVKN